MSETEQKPVFFGTYFNKDGVIALSRWAAIAAWVALGAYTLDWLIYLAIFLLQFSGGLFVEKGDFIFTISNMLLPLVLRPLPGLIYFFALMSIARLLLIFLDIEDNTRRSARAGK
jgi:hypothetical protein